MSVTNRMYIILLGSDSISKRIFQLLKSTE